MSLQAPDSGTSNRPQNWNDVPVKWLHQMMPFLSTSSLLRCMNVNKKWQEVAEHIVKHRDRLILVDDHVEDESGDEESGTNDELCTIATDKAANEESEEGSDDDEDEDSVSQESEESESVKNYEVAIGEMIQQPEKILLMGNLKQLRVTVHNMHGIDNLLKGLIRKNAAHLTELVIHHNVLRDGGVSYPNLRTLHCNAFDAETAVACPGLETLMLCLDEAVPMPAALLPHLTKLSIHYRGSLEQYHPNVFRDFLLTNASTFHEINGPLILPFDATRHVVYENLVELECRDLDEAGGYECPALRSLKLDSRSSLQMNGLLVHQLTHLDMDIDYTVSADGTPAFLDAISRMRNLTKLRLWKLPLLRGIWPGHSLSDLIESMHQLVEFAFLPSRYHVADTHQMDRMVRRLVENNPQLTSVTLGMMSLYDATLSSFAKLSHVNILNVAYRMQVSDAGLLILLRGGPRLTIDFIVISTAFEPVSPDVVTECSLLAQERGIRVRFSRRPYADFFIFG